jgi:alcohol dehydrogenase
MELKTDGFIFSSPTKSLFGPGTARDVGKEAVPLGKKALIVTDSFLSGTEMFRTIGKSLEESGVSHVVFDKVVPNPLDTHVHEGVDTYKKSGCDMLIGLGGGSSIDSAKTIGAIASNGGITQDMLEEDSVKKPLPPFIAIPTTAGTGSEVTIFAVITDSSTHEKLILFSHHLLPDVAVLDPLLTVSLPQNQTVFTGLDALTHAIEAFTTDVSNPLSDAMAMRAIELIGRYLERAYRDGSDLEARSGMMLGSHMAGMAFSNSDLGSVHTMGEVLAGACNIPHGAAMAIFLPYIMDVNADTVEEKYATVSKLLGIREDSLSKGELARRGIEFIKELERTLTLPPLSSFDVDAESFGVLAKQCKEHVCDPINPKKISESEYAELYERAYDNAFGI